MPTIGTHISNFQSSPSCSANAARETSSSHHSVNLKALNALQGQTPFSTTNPSFGSRSDGGFSVGNFLG